VLFYLTNKQRNFEDYSIHRLNVTEHLQVCAARPDQVGCLAAGLCIQVEMLPGELWQFAGNMDLAM